jgi:hypothetical protein
VMLGRIVHSWYVAAVVLQAAALVVPRADRAEWLAEWQGELWHVGRACGADRRSVVHGQQRITAFCAGAFQDAFALQLDACSRRIGGWVKPGTASRCMLLLGSLFVVSFVCSLCLPQVRSAMWKAPARASDSLVLVTKDGYLGDAVPTIRFEEYRAWKANRFPFTTKLVFYRPVTRWVRFNQAPAARLTVAYASETMLGILAPALRAPWPMGHKGESQPRVLLSRGLWRRYFNNGSAVANQTIDIAGQKGGIIGVAPEESWPVPGSVDLVVLESDAALASLSPDTPGFMLAPGIAPALYRDDPGYPYMLASRASGGVVRYECATLSQRRTRPWALFVFALVLACIALPATTPLPLGDYPLGGRSPGAPPSLKRWAFLWSKVALGVSTVYLSSLVLAYGPLPTGSPKAEYAQLLSGFFGLLFTFRWVVRDQRRRCPLCLCALTQPAHVGHPSHIFLAWHGTEMLCASGHGLLYIPEHPTSWSGIQRWQSLDSSWASLFPIGAAMRPAQSPQLSP